jgi:hypothetical protein
MCDEKILVTGSSDGSVAFISADSGQLLARLLNLQCNDDFLITCPPDKTFPNGFFYTTNKDYIQVVMEDKKKRIQKTLDPDDPRRESYLNKLNLKNLVITRLNGNGHYASLTERYNRTRKALSQVSNPNLPPMLSLSVPFNHN